MKIFAKHTAKKLVAVDLADKTSRVTMIGNIRRIFRKDVPDDLIDWIIALFKKSGINLLQDQSVLSFLLASDSESHSLIV